MAKSRLDLEGIQSRNELKGKNRYDNVNIYDENNPDARSRDGEALGKGTGKSMGYAVRDLNAPKTQMNYSVIDTLSDAGGEYDKNGTKGVNKAFQGDSGRNWSKMINIYSKDNQYGLDSIDVDTAVEGQFFVK